MRLLLHICCGICASGLELYLKENKVFLEKITGFWYNPNIHPYPEYWKRQEGVKILLEKLGWPLHSSDNYPLEDWFGKISLDTDRCRLCWELRLRKTAESAGREGFSHFSTTLLISHHQDHNSIKEIGEKLARDYGVQFYSQDFRPFFYQGKDRAKQMGIYSQKYCGCLFSERERYAKIQDTRCRIQD